jgi:hypothetical protein
MALLTPFHNLKSLPSQIHHDIPSLTSLFPLQAFESLGIQELTKKGKEEPSPKSEPLLD